MSRYVTGAPNVGVIMHVKDKAQRGVEKSVSRLHEIRAELLRNKVDRLPPTTLSVYLKEGFSKRVVSAFSCGYTSGRG